MDERILFAAAVFLIAGGYQCYWIYRAVTEKSKWAAIAATGSVYTGTVKYIKSDYIRHGKRLDVYVTLSLPEKGEMLLRNWPEIRHCPYTVGSEAEVLWSPEFPDEFIFAWEGVWQMRGLSPVIDGRFRPKVIKFRFFIVWIIAIAVILIGIAASNYLGSL